MANLAEIVSQFQSLGIELDDETAAACLDLCLKYSLDEESFVNSWIAFSFSQLDGAEPSRDNLVELERKELAITKTPKRLTSTSRVQVFSSGKVFSAAGTPPRVSALETGGSSSKRLVFSPFVSTPDAYTPSEKFNTRKNSGQCVSTLGKSLYEWKSQPSDVDVALFGKADTSKWKFFYDTVGSLSKYLDYVMYCLTKDIVKKHELPDPVPFNDCGLEVMTFKGRVRPYDKAKKSGCTIEVQGLKDSEYAVIDLDVSEVENFAIFPGQAIVFEGVLVGKSIRAKNIYSKATAPQAPPPSLTAPVQILVSAGPFALTDTLSYEPLNDLIDLAKKMEPNVLILVGPLVDATHPKIAQGQIAETFSDYYSRMVKK